MLISPQPWNHIHVSKHHYANQLVEEGHQVLFLEPPLETGVKGRVYFQKESDNLTLLRYRPFFNRRLRFHFWHLYRLLMLIQVQLLRKEIGCEIDLVWCFDFNLYPDLRLFRAGRTIFHPADPLVSNKQRDIALGADLVVSVSDKIIKNFEGHRYSHIKKIVVGHGIGDEFQHLARVAGNPETDVISHVGYAGNLDRRIIDWDTWLNLIRVTPRINYHFWGPFDERASYVEQLRQLGNVQLYGLVSKAELARAYESVDCLLLLYVLDEQESDLSNSHKILEYMSSGRAVISSPIEYFSEFEGSLINFVDADRERDVSTEIVELFADVRKLNSPENVQARKALALKHSYGECVKLINEALRNC